MSRFSIGRFRPADASTFAPTVKGLGSSLSSFQDTSVDDWLRSLQSSMFQERADRSKALHYYDLPESFSYVDPNAEAARLKNVTDLAYLQDQQSRGIDPFWDWSKRATVEQALKDKFGYGSEDWKSRYGTNFSTAVDRLLGEREKLRTDFAKQVAGRGANPSYTGSAVSGTMNLPDLRSASGSREAPQRQLQYGNTNLVQDKRGNKYKKEGTMYTRQNDYSGMGVPTTGQMPPSTYASLQKKASGNSRARSTFRGF